MVQYAAQPQQARLHKITITPEQLMLDGGEIRETARKLVNYCVNPDHKDGKARSFKDLMNIEEDQMCNLAEFILRQTIWKYWYSIEISEWSSKQTFIVLIPGKHKFNRYQTKKMKFTLILFGTIHIHWNRNFREKLEIVLD